MLLPLSLLACYRYILASDYASLFYPLVGILGGIVLITILSDFFRAYFSTQFTCELQRRQRQSTFDSYFTQLSALKDRTHNDMNAVLKTLLYRDDKLKDLPLMIACWVDIPFMLIIMVWLSSIHLIFASVSLLFGILSFLLLLALYKQLQRIEYPSQSIPVEQQVLLFSGLEKIMSIKAWVTQSLYIKRFDTRLRQSQETLYLGQLYQLRSQRLLTGFYLLTSLAIFVFGCQLLTNEQLDLGLLLVSLYLLWQLYQRLTVFIQRIAQAEIFAENMPEQATLAKRVSTEKKQEQNQLTLQGNIKIKALHFSFSNVQGHTAILKGVDLHVTPGDIIAIYGHQGCGKTTLLNLIRGTLVASQGCIYYDEQLPDEHFSQLSSAHIIYLRPPPCLFRGSILDNLTLFQKDNLTLKKAEQYLSAFNIATKIKALPQAEQTYLSETNFHLLSASLTQKIIWIRILLRCPSLILCDDVDGMRHAQTDILNAQQAFQCIEGKTLTFILTAKKPDTVHGFKRRYRLDNGCLKHVE